MFHDQGSISWISLIQIQFTLDGRHKNGPGFEHNVCLLNTEY